MLFGGNQTHEEIINDIVNNVTGFDNLIAMANIGAVFSAISVFEDSVAILISTSKASLSKKLDQSAIADADLFLERHNYERGSTLGRLVTVLEKSGMEGRDVRYLRSIVDLRNDFVHRLMDQVPLPGDWTRFGYSLERFSQYTKCMLRHVHFASYHFSRIMVKNDLLAGEFGSFGGFLWNPDLPYPPMEDQ